MTVEVKSWDQHAPGTYSSFANDDRCYEVHYLTGDDQMEVFDEIRRLLRRDKTLIDYDLYFDSVIEKWVGVTCRDY